MRNIIDFTAQASFLFLLAISSLFPSIASAKTFTNSYVSFDLPKNWDCYLENTAWICRFSLPKSCASKQAMKKKECLNLKKKTKEAIIILTAKEKGPTDSFEAYKAHLQTPRTIRTRKKTKAQSKVLHVKSVKIGKGKQRWVDGFHLGSEIPYYYTRYLATIKGNIAVLVTFSAHKLHYSKYSKAFFAAIKSLEVVASQADTAKVGKNSPNGSLQGTIGGAYSSRDFLVDETVEETESESVLNSEYSEYLLMIAMALAAIGVFFWIKGR